MKSVLEDPLKDPGHWLATNLLKRCRVITRIPDDDTNIFVQNIGGEVEFLLGNHLRVDDPKSRLGPYVVLKVLCRRMVETNHNIVTICKAKLGHLMPAKGCTDISDFLTDMRPQAGSQKRSCIANDCTRLKVALVKESAAS